MITYLLIYFIDLNLDIYYFLVAAFAHICATIWCYIIIVTLSIYVSSWWHE